MPKIYKCLSAKSDITGLSHLEDFLLAYSTEFHGIKIFDFKECDVKKSIANTYLNQTVRASAFSPDSHMFVFVNGKTVYILDIDSKEIVQTIDTNEEDIDIVSFDLSSDYIIAGTKSGRVLQYKIGSSALLARLCSFPYDRSTIRTKQQESKNYVSSFAFYKSLFACSGYGGAVYIMDIYAQTYKDVIAYDNIRTNAMVFLDKDTLVCAKDNGRIDIVPIGAEHNRTSIQTPIGSINNIIIMPNPNYLMLSGDSHIITIIDIKNSKIAHSKYIELHAKIKYIRMVQNDSLVIALQSNEIIHVELPGITKLKSIIMQNMLKEAFELIDKEPMLQDSYEHTMLQKRFEKSYEAALNYLINQNVSQAQRILSPFKDVKSKQNKIKELFSSFEHYLRFQALFLEKKYAIAYAMCSKYEPLKRTVYYKKMERIFRDVFANAQRHILQNDIPAARALLMEYNSVISKKPLIKLLLTQNKEFIDLLRAIGKNDFKNINRLVDKNNLFRQIPNYIAMNDRIQESIIDIERKIDKGEVQEAKKLLLDMQEVEHVEEKIQKLLIKCKYTELLYNAYAADNFQECYELLDLHRSLRETELGALLEKHWQTLIQKCEGFALEGNIKKIKKSLGILMRISTRSNKTGDLLRVSFHAKILSLIEAINYKSAEAIIYSYIDIFGLDSEINTIMGKFENISGRKLAITQSRQERYSRDSWMDSDIIMRGL